MKLLAGHQIRNWDQYTIEKEPITSIDLMERAAVTFSNWFSTQSIYQNRSIDVLCGNGNNGGDGLAIARILRNRFYGVRVHVLRFAGRNSLDFDINLKRLISLGDVDISFIQNEMPDLNNESVIIDALLGTGVDKPVQGILDALISKINSMVFKSVISVDMPSGLPPDSLYIGNTMRPDIIYTFQVPKLCFFYKENAEYCPEWVIGNIGLHNDYLENIHSDHFLIDHFLAKGLLKSRTRFQRKGDFGHVLLIGGSDGKIGAAILSAKASLRSGAGLVTAMVPAKSADIIHTAIPEAMVRISGQSCFSNNHFHYDHKIAIGCGPGLGTDILTKHALGDLLLKVDKSIVLDADALNIISEEKSLKDLIPKNSILTPHTKEFERLFGLTKNSKEMFELQLEMSIKYHLNIVLKGAFSRVTTPDGQSYINTTGNPGMATAGSGDVLTGIISGLLAQKYSPKEAAILGVYIHGLAGDKALQYQSVESMMASDIISHLGAAFKALEI
ncbi:MAG: NAD(P)H-hydrate dehydratase [Saprospiraceae bacterium]|nr:NAD(P)H-hydrate dehydratase [Saprospiraceae bacterium]